MPTVCWCGGQVPSEQGPAHASMRAAPACWRLYGVLTVGVREHEGADVDLRQRASAVVLPRFDLNDWPLLSPPPHLGRLTVTDLHAASEDELPALARAWPSEVWLA